MSSNVFANQLKTLASESDKKVPGEKGAMNYKETGKFILDFLGAMTQVSTRKEVKHHLNVAMSRAQTGEDIMHLVVSIVNFRDPRNGKGFKDTTAFCLLELYNYYPQLVIEMMEFVAEFGCIQDYWKLITFINGEIPAGQVTQSFYNYYNPLIQSIFGNFWKLFDRDLEIISEFNTKYSQEQRPEKMGELISQLSNSGKWMVGEKSSYGRKTYWFLKNGNRFQKLSLFKILVNYKYTRFGADLYKQVRSLTKSLRTICEIPEQKMCARWNEGERGVVDSRFSQINFSRAPGKFLIKFTKALLNETKEPLAPYQESDGNRVTEGPKAADRIACRKKLMEFLKKAPVEKLNAGALAPYEILRKIISGNTSTAELLAMEAMWKACVEKTREKIVEYKKEILIQNAERDGVPLEELDLENITFDNVIPMIDVSGSMCCEAAKGVTCMEIAIAQGIMAAELNTGHFKNVAISFTDIPRLFHFVDAQGKELTLAQKYHKIMEYVGYSTEVSKAYDLVLDIAVKNKVPQKDIPSILCLSDMGFDTANRMSHSQSSVYYSMGSQINVSQWNTTYENTEAKFKAAGYDMPMVYFWNLNIKGARSGHQAQAHTKGVSMLTGWSTDSFKAVMSGQVVIEPVKPEVQEQSELKSSWDDFLAMIRQGCYVYVRELCNHSEEKLLKDYHFSLEEIAEDIVPRTIESMRTRGIQEDENIDVVTEEEVQEAIQPETGEGGVEEKSTTKTWSQTIFGM